MEKYERKEKRHRVLTSLMVDKDNWDIFKILSFNNNMTTTKLLNDYIEKYILSQKNNNK